MSLEALKEQYKEENPSRWEVKEKLYTKTFLKWIKQKKFFHSEKRPVSINILSCLIDKICTSGNNSKDIRRVIKRFINQHFEKVLEIKCPINTLKVMSVSLEKDQINLLETFKNLGFCCSRSEVLRFILFYEFLRGDKD